MRLIAFTLAFLAHKGHTSVIEKRQNDGSTPAYPTDPSTVSDCTYWVNVQSGYTCASIEDYYSLSAQTFQVKLNPSIKSDCSGLKVGYSYCVEENHGIITTTSTTSTTTKTTTTSSTTKTTSGPEPEQTGITSDCKRYYQVVSGDTCQSIVDSYGTFTLSQFYSWNPAVGNTCGNLLAGYYVCVGVTGTPTTRTTTTTTSKTSSGPEPEQTGITKSCTRYYKVQDGDTCQGIVDSFGEFTLQQFYSWNPAVGSDCRSLQAGYYVCVGIPGTPTTRTTSTKPSPTAACPTPQQSGTIKTCKTCYKVASGDTCAKIEQNKHVSDANFRKWNPGINSQCSNLQLGYYICIAA